MKTPEIGEAVRVVSFKHDGRIHRIWENTTCIMKSHEMIALVNNSTRVIEGSGTSWQTREPAVSFFFPDKWFNIIGMLRRDGVHFYCNMASPFIYEDGAVKYIDYDLDVKVFPNFEYRIVDHMEYENHKAAMNYPEAIDKILKEQLDKLIEMLMKRYYPFDSKFVIHTHHLYNKHYAYARKDLRKPNQPNGKYLQKGFKK